MDGFVPITIKFEVYLMELIKPGLVESKDSILGLRASKILLIFGNP